MSARLFVAAELPGAVVEALVGWRPDDDALRPVAPEALHVTLAFLGSRDESEVPAIETAIGQVARPVRALSLGRALWLPRRRPRVLAVELWDGDGGLGAMQRDLVSALVDGIGFQPERRAFLAHVTVSRVRTVDGALPDLEPPPGLGAFPATALTLFESHLSSRGACYEALARAPLDP